MKVIILPRKVEYGKCPRCEYGSGHVTKSGGLSCFICGLIPAEEMEAAEAQAIECVEEPHPFTAADERDEQMNARPEVCF